MREMEAVILSNRMVALNQFEMELKPDGELPKIGPGQFAMVSVNDNSRILRRPFSIFRISPKGTFSIFYRASGEGTRNLSRQEKGLKLSVLLPLGNGFDLKAFEKQTVYCVAGGIGFASVFPLALKLGSPVKFFYGCRTKSEFTPVPKNMECHYSTEDGSRGYKGFVTDVVGEHLKKDLTAGKKIVVAACGPMAMLKNLDRTVKSTGKDVPVWLSFEERMACGVGVCMGCVIRTKNGLECTCKKGPVFDSNGIVWD
jgi:dihydroorotate dehydrogenase electron transfer subunit